MHAGKDSSMAKRAACLPENPSSVSSTHIRQQQLTTDCKSTSVGSHVLLCLCRYTHKCVQTHNQTRTYKQLNGPLTKLMVFTYEGCSQDGLVLQAQRLWPSPQLNVLCAYGSLVCVGFFFPSKIEVQNIPFIKSREPIKSILFLVVILSKFQKSYKDKHGVMLLEQANRTFIMKTRCYFLFFLNFSKRSNESTLVRLPVSRFLMRISELKASEYLFRKDK